MSNKRQELVVVGIGYVGLVTACCLAKLGVHVTAIDNDKNKIAELKNLKVPIYEPGLDLIIRESQDNLFFTDNLKSAMQNATNIMIAVGTPMDENGDVDISYLTCVVNEIAECLLANPRNVNVIIKSTVPIGTNKIITDFFADKNLSVNVISNPEFLREGQAIKDFMEPDRVVIGANSHNAAVDFATFYAKLNSKIIITTPESAELGKYAANGFLAAKIAYINQIAEVCDKSGANILEVADIIGSDPRIGNQFLRPGPGFGGSCFPKDIRALLAMSKKLAANSSITEAIIKANDLHQDFLADKIKNIAGDFDNIAIFGLAFKAGTDDIRESPAISIIRKIEHYNIAVYDPEAMNNARALLGEKVRYAQDPYELTEGADILIILTEWGEFKNLDYIKIYQLMRKKVIIDFRLILNRDEMEQIGFSYYDFG